MSRSQGEIQLLDTGQGQVRLKMSYSSLHPCGSSCSRSCMHRLSSMCILHQLVNGPTMMYKVMQRILTMAVGVTPISPHCTLMKMRSSSAWSLPCVRQHFTLHCSRSSIRLDMIAQLLLQHLSELTLYLWIPSVHTTQRKTLFPSGKEGMSSLPPSSSSLGLYEFQQVHGSSWNPEDHILLGSTGCLNFTKHQVTAGLFFCLKLLKPCYPLHSC